MDAATAPGPDGIRERKSITSTLMPSVSSCFAASNDFCTVAPQVTIVRSRPGRIVDDLPSGMR